MKLGLGLYRHMLNDEYYSFAVQAGCTHVIAHLVDYFRQGAANPVKQSAHRRQRQALGRRRRSQQALDGRGADRTCASRSRLPASSLKASRTSTPRTGTTFFSTAPSAPQHIQNVQAILRAMGEAGIGTLGYNFSIAGVCGRVSGPFARGGAESVGMDGPVDTPIPNGMVWNMIYDPNAAPGTLPIHHPRRALASPAALP